MASNEDETTPLLTSAQPAPLEPIIEHERLLGDATQSIRNSKRGEIKYPAIPGPPVTMTTDTSIEVSVGDGQYITQSLSSLQNSANKVPQRLRTS